MRSKVDLSNQIVEIGELHKILGYQDERSVLRWCKKHDITIIKLGLKKYFPSHLLTQILDNQLFKFVEKKKTDTKNEKKYLPQNEIVSQYLSKYESTNQTKSTGKRQT